MKQTRPLQSKIGTMLPIAALTILAAAVAARETAAEPAPAAATIVQSGSTNRAGFRITVERSGEAEMIPTGRRSTAPDKSAAPVRQKLPDALAKRFYTDLEAAKPFSALPVLHCMKSVSFGFTLQVELNEETTPDLSCGDGGNAVLHNLIRDVNEIAAVFRDGR